MNLAQLNAKWETEINAGKGAVKAAQDSAVIEQAHRSGTDKLMELNRQWAAQINPPAAQRPAAEPAVQEPAVQTDDRPGKFSLGKTAAATVETGSANVFKRALDAASWLEDVTLGNLFPGSTENSPIKALQAKQNDYAARQEQTRAEEAAKGGKAAQTVSKYGVSVVEAIPQAVLAMATAGSTAAAQAGTAGLETISAAAQRAPGILSAVRTAGASMAKDPQYWASFVQAVGGSYEQAKADGASDNKAQLYALTNGLMNAAVEVGGGIQTLPAELRGGKAAVRAWIDGMLDEGKEEVVQGIIERGLQNVVYGQDNPVASLSDPRAVINPAAAAEEFKGGAVVGGVLGGGQALTNAAAQKVGQVRANDAAADEINAALAAVGANPDAQNAALRYAAQGAAPNTQTPAASRDALLEAIQRAQTAQAERGTEAGSTAQEEQAAQTPSAALPDAAAARSADPAGNETAAAGVAPAAAEGARSDALLRAVTGQTVTAPAGQPGGAESAPGVNTPGAPAASDGNTYGDAGGAVGAAGEGFDPFSRAELEYGTQDGAANSVRPDDAPVSTNGRDRVSRTTVTAKGAAVTPDDFVPLLERSVMDTSSPTGLRYIPITNSETVERAEATIAYKGWEQTLRDWQRDVASGRNSAELTAIGALLYNNAVNSGDAELALDIISDYAAMGREAARALQAMRILQTLTPENRLYMMQKSVARLIDEARLPEGTTISDELQTRYLQAETEEARDAVIEEIMQDIADRMPSTLLDKWNTVRYVNMLGNFKTQARNVLGNVGMQALSNARYGIATGLEAAVSRASGGRLARTKAFVRPGSDLWKASDADFANMEAVTLGEGRYSLSEARRDGSAFRQGIEERRTLMKFGDNALTRSLGIAGRQGPVGRAVEGYRNVTNWAMEKGDVIFSRASYTRALAGYLKAHNVTAEQFSSDAWKEANAAFVDRARAYAVQEAQEDTFRDVNAVSEWISRAGRGTPRNNFERAMQLLGEGLMPFRRTPADVMVRAEEYSPLGLINTAVEAAQLVRGSGDVTGADVIDSLAKSLTGTGLFVAGMLLRKAGLLRGAAPEDEKQANFEELTGQQEYSIVLPDGTNYTADWVAPGSIPLFMGAALADAADENGLRFQDLEGALTQLTEPMLQMSMLQGVDDTLNQLKYSNNNLLQIAGTLAASYLTQGLTNSLVGQAERTFERVRMSTYTSKDSPLPSWLQREIGRASAKTPGMDYHQYPYIDAWGREEESGDLLVRAAQNFLSPGYVDRAQMSDVEQELSRLASATGDTNVYPKTAEKSFKVGDEIRRLTMEEYVQYAKLKGQRSEELVKAITASPEYRKLSEEAKAKAVGKAYLYANAKAKAAVSDYQVTAEVANMEKNGTGIGDVAKYILAKVGG